MILLCSVPCTNNLTYIKCYHFSMLYVLCPTLSTERLSKQRIRKPHEQVVR